MILQLDQFQPGEAWIFFKGVSAKVELKYNILRPPLIGLLTHETAQLRRPSLRQQEKSDT